MGQNPPGAWFSQPLFPIERYDPAFTPQSYGTQQAMHMLIFCFDVARHRTTREDEPLSAPPPALPPALPPAPPRPQRFWSRTLRCSSNGNIYLLTALDEKIYSTGTCYMCSSQQTKTKKMHSAPIFGVVFTKRFVTHTFKMKRKSKSPLIYDTYVTHHIINNIPFHYVSS